MMVVARQSKSLVLGIWSRSPLVFSVVTRPMSRSSLVASCSQLSSLDPSKSSSGYILPKGGLQEGLAGQIVLL